MPLGIVWGSSLNALVCLGSHLRPWGAPSHMNFAQPPPTPKKEKMNNFLDLIVNALISDATDLRISRIIAILFLFLNLWSFGHVPCKWSNLVFLIVPLGPFEWNPRLYTYIRTYVHYRLSMMTLIVVSIAQGWVDCGWQLVAHVAQFSILWLEGCIWSLFIIKTLCYNLLVDSIARC